MEQQQQQQQYTAECEDHSEDHDDDDCDSAVSGAGAYLDDLVELSLADELLFFAQFFIHLLSLYSICYFCSMRRFLADQVTRFRAAVNHRLRGGGGGALALTAFSASLLVLLRVLPLGSSSILLGWLTFHPAVFPQRGNGDDYIDPVNGRRRPRRERERPAAAAADAHGVVVVGQGSSAAAVAGRR